MIQAVSVKKTLETFEELGNCPSDYISGDGGKDFLGSTGDHSF